MTTALLLLAIFATSLTANARNPPYERISKLERRVPPEPWNVVPPQAIDITKLDNEGNAEDYMGIDNDDIPDILPHPSAWRNSDGTQKDLYEISPAGQNGLWAEALAKGTLIKQWLGNSLEAQKPRGSLRDRRLWVLALLLKANRSIRRLEEKPLSRLAHVYMAR